MAWLNEFKLALLNENIDSLNDLLDNIELSDKTLLPQAIALLKEAQKLIIARRDAKACEIQKLRKAMHYMN